MKWLRNLLFGSTPSESYKHRTFNPDKVVLHGRDGGEWAVVKAAGLPGYFYGQGIGLGVQWFYADTVEEARDIGESFRAVLKPGYLYK